MLAYYLDLAIRSLGRNPVLSVLTVIAVAVGIGTSMTVFTMFRALSGDPIPEKSSQLHLVLIDNWGPNANIPEKARSHLSYIDAMALMQGQGSQPRNASYATYLTVMPQSASASPFTIIARATDPAFFSMFDVPFRSGGPWKAGESNAVVLSDTLAARLFPGAGAVGHEIVLNGQSYRVTGVLRRWDPQPRFHDLQSAAEELFLPFSAAIEHRFFPIDSQCNAPRASGFAGLLSSECIWIAFWVELPDNTAVTRYGRLVQNYAAEQTRAGRFQWPAKYGLYDVRDWLVRQKVVTDEVRLSTLAAFGFLIVCLLNACSLLLAKFASRMGSLSVHRAMGASRVDVLAQCLAETAILGCGGGLLGLALTIGGLQIERSIMGDELDHLTQLDGGIVMLTLALAVVATLICGLYPSWRASRVPPAVELKTQ